MQQIEELQGKYNGQLQQCCALSNKLDATQVSIFICFCFMLYNS